MTDQEKIAILEKENAALKGVLVRIKGEFNSMEAGYISQDRFVTVCAVILSSVPTPLAVVDDEYYLTHLGYICTYSDPMYGGPPHTPVTVIVLPRKETP